MVMQRKRATTLALCIFSIFSLLTAAQSRGQLVYSTEYKSDADVKVFVSKYKSDADLIVYKAPYKSDVEGNNGIWYFSEYKSDAKKKIYFTDYKSDADLVIYFTEYKSDAGWQHKNKQQLMY